MWEDLRPRNGRPSAGRAGSARAKETFTGSDSASDFALGAGGGVLVVLRGQRTARRSAHGTACSS